MLSNDTRKKRNFAEFSQTSLEELTAVMNKTKEYFILPKIFDTDEFRSLSSVISKNPGFCADDKELEIAVFTIQTQTSVNAIFYGCRSRSYTNFKLILIDKSTAKKKFDQFSSEKINWKFNATFCKCRQDFDRIRNCALINTSDTDILFLMLIIAVYVAVLLILIFASRTPYLGQS